MVQRDTEENVFSRLNCDHSRNFIGVALRFMSQSLKPPFSFLDKTLKITVSNDLQPLLFFNYFIFQCDSGLAWISSRGSKGDGNAAVIYNFEPESQIFFASLMHFSWPDMIEFQVHIWLRVIENEI